MSHKCSWPDCQEDGEFPAPRDPKNIGERQYFCQAHIKEFNKSWNGLRGFSEDEIFSMQHGGATWNRPTWSFGVNGEGMTPGKMGFRSADDLLAYFRERRINGARVQHNKNPRALPPDVQEACMIMALDTPKISGAKLKQQYLSLVKKHHPDVNRGSRQAEETVKKINVAYRILKDYSLANAS